MSRSDVGEPASCNSWWCELCYTVPSKRASDLGEASSTATMNQSIKIHNELVSIFSVSFFPIAVHTVTSFYCNSMRANNRQLPKKRLADADDCSGESLRGLHCQYSCCSRGLLGRSVHWHEFRFATQKCSASEQVCPHLVYNRSGAKQC